MQGAMLHGLHRTCFLVCVREQLGWSNTLARVSRLERVTSISLHQINTKPLIKTIHRL